ncbi:MAG: DUF5060 domain-containing protein [Bacteroidales bacterium]|nr:DUF5060 domain-containing protein [Bacteroidales bacterium]
MKTISQLLLVFFLILIYGCDQTVKVKVTGELKTWHKVTLELPAHYADEKSIPNPFLDCRLEATFTMDDRTYTVPGYFAADGLASETGATSGQVWKVHFSPDQPGIWDYRISFRCGKNIAVSDDPDAGNPLPLDGRSGSFEVESTNKNGRDFRAKGRLINTGERYLRHAGTGEYFIKGGADSPENFLAYSDFDGTYYGGNNQQRSGEDAPNAGLHAYEPHVADWEDGDPEWQDGKGKGIIGAINYLASKGMNSVYFLTMNVLGDGEDVWPYTDRNERYRFDCSRLDQWEVVFSHMEQLGIMMHVVLQETENENVLDGGYLDVQRKLYLRELVARFSHHNAITWNLGEEHGPVGWMEYFQSVDDTKRMADYLRKTDPYDHFIVMHTHPNPKNRAAYLPNYFSHESFDGPSIQAGNPYDSHQSTLKWIEDSREAGKLWVVCIDEIGQHWKGAMPDEADPAHDTIRQQVLWGNLMAGGAGVEWYFGYRYPHGDLSCEDWRSRDILWDQTRYAIEFFQNYLPFSEMENMDVLISYGYCLAKPGEVYAIYFTGEGVSTVDLRGASGQFDVKWYDPGKGGQLMDGTVTRINAGGLVSPGLPPDSDLNTDWVCLIRKK